MFGRMKDPADGTATVVGYSEQHVQKGADVVLSAQVIVEAEGMAATTVDAKPEVPQSWMPVKTGTVWPVRVDRANPSRLKFLWERVQGAAAPAAPPVIARSVQAFSLPPSIQVMGASSDPVSRLERLAELLDAGDITREEFDAQKKRILGSTS
jgi:hypothetical protein